MKNKLYKILLVLLPILIQWSCTKEIEPISASVSPITIENTEGFRAGTDVKFSASATNFSTVKWEFLFNNTELIESTIEVSPTRKFSTPGNYTVVFKAIGGGGSAGIKKTFIINPNVVNPNVDFTITPNNNSEAPCEVTVTASSNTGITEFEWNWGDGTSNSKTSNITSKHTYNKEGNYSIILSVRYSNGSTASLPVKTIIIKPTPSVTVTKAWSFGEAGPNFLKTATDQAGNVYVVGYFLSSCSFGPKASGETITLSSQLGSAPFFVAKYNNTGILVWAKKYENANVRSPFPNDIAISKNNTLYVSYKNYALDNNKSVGSGFVKFDAITGDIIKEKSFSDQNTEVRGLALDSDENIVIGGKFSGIFEKVRYENRDDQDVGFVMKYNSNGDAIWKSPRYFYGGLNKSAVEKVAVAKDNNIYFTGGLKGINNISSTLGLVASTFSCNGYNTIIGKLDINGSPIWVRQNGIDNTNPDYISYPYRIIADNDNNVLILDYLYFGVGSTFGTITLKNRNKNQNGDNFLVKYKSDGTFDFFQYAYSDNDNNTYVGDLNKDNDGNILLSGTNTITKLTNTGISIFTNRPIFSASATDTETKILSIASDVNNNLFVAGRLTGKITIGGQDFNGKSKNDMFILRYGK